MVLFKSSTGTWTQAVRGGGNGFRDNDLATGLALDGSGKVVITGNYSGRSILLGPFTLNSTSRTAMFIARLNSSGVWTQAVGAGGSSILNFISPMALAVDGNGNATVSGTFGSTTTFGPIIIGSASGGQLAFIARLGGIISGTKTAITETMTLAPNPVSSYATLTLTSRITARTILLFDAMGREVRRQTLPSQVATAIIDVMGLAPSIYTIKCGAAAGKLLIN
jgi:hypothetical protein